MTDYTLDSVGLADPSADPFDLITEGDIKFIHVRKKEAEVICPHCGLRMRSKGWQKERTIRGVGSIGGYRLQLVLHQRKWFCRACNYYYTDQFSFIDPFKQTSSLLPYLVANDMRDLNVTAAQLAKKYSVSDTYIIQAFMSVVCPQRLPLPEIICVDEVFLNFDYKHKYPMVLLDFATGEPLDIVSSRRKEFAHQYFLSIPHEERRQVKYVISDMYDYYTHLAGNIFPNAVGIVDSFHVIAALNGKILSYINAVKKRYQTRDRDQLKMANENSNRTYKTRKDSLEVYLLKEYYWLLTSNEEHISYTHERRYISAMDAYWDLYDISTRFMKLDSRFEYIRAMKEKYITFNNGHNNDLEGAEKELDILIKDYDDSGFWIFKEFAETLRRYRKEIIASFTCISSIDPDTGEVTERRLSNGPAEGFNNFPKDLKRMSNGLSNFEYARARILWARRINPAVLAVPRPFSEFHREGKERGPYRIRK